MRYCNPSTVSQFSPRPRRWGNLNMPYQLIIDGSRANSKRRYIQIMQYVADHDGCKRKEIIEHIYHKRCPQFRGQCSLMFSNLLYRDFIDYDKRFHYHITDKGMALLKKVYLNDMANTVLAK